jgi:hypothetical protein
MSHAGIAAVLALEDLTTGERLSALSLASYANRDQRAWPGNKLAALRAGLSVSQYLNARGRLQNQGVIAIEPSGGGRGNATVVTVICGRSGPWIEREVNAQRLERVLASSNARGAARLLLAVLAAVSDGEGVVEALSTDSLCALAGLSDSGYRRARSAILATDEISLADAGGGRGRTNRWLLGAYPDDGPSRRVPTPRQLPAATRPLMAIATTPETVTADWSQTEVQDACDVPAQDEAPTTKGPALTGVFRSISPILTGVSPTKGPIRTGVWPNPVPDRTDSGQTPPQTPSQTPSPYVRAGRESQNPQTPPQPPSPGGHTPVLEIQASFLTSSGRRRTRVETVPLSDARRQLRPLGPEDRLAWQAITHELAHRLGSSTTAIWFADVSPAAVEPDGCLLLSCPTSARSWITTRYARVLAAIADTVGRPFRLMTDREQQLHAALQDLTNPLPHPNHQEAV